MRPSHLAWSIVLALVLAAGSACGPGVDDDTVGGTNDTSAGAETTQGTATTGTTETPVTATNAVEGSGSSTGGPVDCYLLLTEDECTAFPECQTSRGTEALPTDVPGEYSCSDAAFPFGCAPIDCEPFTGIICNVDDPGVARWLFEPKCVPGGWEPCPGDPICV